MPVEEMCKLTGLELSVAHDEGRPPSDEAKRHMATCAACTAFGDNLADLDRLLARGETHLAPDMAPAVVASVAGRPRRSWWSVAAVAAVGVLIGLTVGGVGRIGVVQARDLANRLHAASPSVAGLSADLLIVERGWQTEVPERVYVGTLEYSAPERLAIDVTDTTSYPEGEWVPNDVSIAVADGDVVWTASPRCPVDALPSCQEPPSTVALRAQRPFDEGVVIPLEIVGPQRSLAWWSGIDVVGSPTLDGRPTIQVETTVAGAELIRAITDRGAWRELHPTDRVLMWMDEATLAPMRIEVFAARSPERELWQLRRGYDDGDEPILIIELGDLVTGPVEVVVNMPAGAASGGFADGPAEVPEPELDAGFARHRSGHWPLPGGGEVDVVTWSDGRSWVKVEATDDWSEQGLFGIGMPFVQRIDLGAGSVGYLAPDGDALAVHTAETDVLVSASVTEGTLVALAESLGVTGLPVPDHWAEAAIVEPDRLPPGTLAPDVEGWSMLGTAVADETTILMTGAGRRTVLITSEPGSRLDPPLGADFLAVDLRGTRGRFDEAAAMLEWIEDGRIVRMRSETVGRAELLDLAEAMVPR